MLNCASLKSAAASTQLQPGSHCLQEGLEDIQLGRLLGRGSFGRVYLAEYQGRPVAVKVCWCTLCMQSVSRAPAAGQVRMAGHVGGA